jgi:hypothetical protein
MAPDLPIRGVEIASEARPIAKRGSGYAIALLPPEGGEKSEVGPERCGNPNVILGVPRDPFRPPDHCEESLSLP